ncbi:hypothetical protein M758_4G114200 [Ceratodon purpureus]|nr:hypothetical protein M758_4G114200 [Ceratodon purpureus]
MLLDFQQASSQGFKRVCLMQVRKCIIMRCIPSQTYNAHMRPNFTKPTQLKLIAQTHGEMKNLNCKRVCAYRGHHLKHLVRSGTHLEGDRNLQHSYASVDHQPSLGRFNSRVIYTKTRSSVSRPLLESEKLDQKSGCSSRHAHFHGDRRCCALVMSQSKRSGIPEVVVGFKRYILIFFSSRLGSRWRALATVLYV